ncbi:hypothetical protein [Niveispirillum sp.]|uniref:hypothetical protein n=1 Tax=Niveispirillum sp. TaxID=1917217 RepID=UPI001B603698|nr:hypothetical protein [Niveispirillum sp.]MBP7337252.1 hypothetical protein [Niveispirillum sp.]
MLDRLVPLLMPLLTRDIGTAARQVGRDGILYAVMAFLGLVGFALALAGSVVWLKTWIGTGPALLAVAGVVLLPIPIILGLMAHWHRAEQKRREKDKAAEMVNMAVSTLVPLLLRAPGLFMAVAVGLIAFLVFWGDEKKPDENAAEKAKETV